LAKGQEGGKRPEAKGFLKNKAKGQAKAN